MREAHVCVKLHAAREAVLAGVKPIAARRNVGGKSKKPVVLRGERGEEMMASGDEGWHCCGSRLLQRALALSCFVMAAIKSAPNQLRPAWRLVASMPARRDAWQHHRVRPKAYTASLMAASVNLAINLISTPV